MSKTSVPPFAGNIGFNAQHSPMGAFASFTCGHFGTSGGMGVEIGQPAGQDLYIGIKDGDRFSEDPLRCLPFYRGAGGAGEGAAAFLVEQAGPAEQAAASDVMAFAVEQLQRHYGWATDRWVAGQLRFSIYSPFSTIPEPSADIRSLRDALAPAVVAELVVDNRTGSQTRTATFSVEFNQPGACLVTVGRDAAGRVRHAFSLRERIGFAAESDAPADAAQQLFPIQRWNVADGLRDANPVHQLGRCCGFGIEVPAGQVRTMRLAFGCFLNGVVTTGLEGRYLYTRVFSSLADVLEDVLTDERFTQRVERATALDEDLLNSGLTSEQQFLVAHATRSYYGSTQLLDIGGEPFWIVNEGEYCMMNTLDLAVDQVFWELAHNPWVVRNLLDNFVRRYSYVDQVKSSSQKLSPGGIAFTHDMGAHNNFSPPGHSSYELPNLDGCFSYMTAEQLCNWTLMAACYVAKTNDQTWLLHNQPVIEACLGSFLNRGGDAGFCQFDSSRCGTGAEITTYDSLDHSLAQTRANVYMATKTWASYLGLSILLRRIGAIEAAEQAYDGMLRIAEWVNTHADGEVLPAVFEKDNPGYTSRILPAIEGLLYAWYWENTKFNPEAFDDLADQPQNSAFLKKLTTHARALLLDPERRNFFDDGGLRLSSTSNNSWMSKIAIVQHVIREVLHLDDEPAVDELLKKADAAHVKWQTDGSSYWACCDQIVNGVARGSRYYPRIITTALWMHESRR